MKKWILCLGICFYTLSIFGQGKQMYAGDKLVKRNNYSKAVDFYKEAIPLLDSEERKQEVYYKIAACFFKMNNYNEAVRWYEDAIGDVCDKADWETSLGDALAHSGRLEQAIEVYEKAQSLGADERVAQKLKSAQRAFEVENNSVNIVKPAEGINSNYSDYAPSWFGDELVFASTRSQDRDKIDGRTGQSYSNLYVSSYDSTKNTWSLPTLLDTKVNSQFNEGTFAYNRKQTVGYWMECNDHSNHCVIKKGKYNKETASWEDIKEIELNSNSYSLGHPAFDSLSNILYFASEMPGGKGGKDIWKANLKNDGSWGRPINLGDQVNTEYDEVFPYLMGDSILFFSSNGQNGLGGLDIFFSLKKAGNFGKAKHLESPFNSYADDFGLIMFPSGQDGLLSSNRNNTKSDDIYQFKGFPVSFNVRGNIKDGHNRKALEKAQVLVKNLKTKSVDTVYSKEDGKWFYPAGFFAEYEFTFKKETYQDEVRKIITPGKERIMESSTDTTLEILMYSKDFPCQIAGKVIDRESQRPLSGIIVYLQSRGDTLNQTSTSIQGNYSFDNLKPGLIYVARVNEKNYFQEARTCKIPDERKSITCSKVNGYDMDFELTNKATGKEFILSNIYYDFDKANLRETSKIELKKFVSMLKENPRVKMRINSHTDDRGSHAYNDDLSQRRAQSVMNFLTLNGISRELLSAKGFGKRNLLIKNAKTEAEHQANRRTTFEITDFLEEEIQEKPLDVIAQEPVKNKTQEKSEELIPEKEIVQIEAKEESLPVLYIEDNQIHFDESEGPIKDIKPVDKEIDQPIEIIQDMARPEPNLDAQPKVAFHIQLLSTGNPLQNFTELEKLIQNHSEYQVYEQNIKGVYKYEVGPVYQLRNIAKLKQLIKSNGHQGGFTVAYENGHRISMEEAKKKLNQE